MPTLILVRHSLSDIRPNLPPQQWPLAEEGRRRCRKLAEKLRPYNPDVIVTSLEPKALETGQIVAGILGKPFQTAAGLHEHERSQSEFTTKEAFEAQVARLFEYPEQLIFGQETTHEAYTRYSNALAAALRNFPERTLAVVSHGTVMSLFVARANGFEPFPFWKRLGLPAFVVLSLPEFHVLADIENIE